jgi:hypothetical protein
VVVIWIGSSWHFFFPDAFQNIHELRSLGCFTEAAVTKAFVKAGGKLNVLPALTS